MMRLFFIIATIGFIVTGAWYIYENNHKSQEDSANHTGAQGAPIPVRVAAARTGDINVFLDELGNVTPRNTVTVHSRVEGQLVRILFTEGQLVKAGDLLVELDASPYRAQLTQAQGMLKKDQALLKDAKIKRDRYKTLLGQDAIAQQEFDTQQSLVDQYEGASENDMGQIESARVQIAYTQITTPVSGRIGLRQVDLGNIVHVNDQNGIAVITEMDPIDVVFAIPEDKIQTILERTQNNEKLAVVALDREEGRELSVGVLSALDSQVDTATGTVKCKAEFSNKKSLLFPNQFVNVRLLLEVRHNALLVPGSAVQHGTNGSFVFVVKNDKSVTIRPVKLGPAEGGDVAIESSLKAGEIVVIDGTDRLREGSKIEIMQHIAAPAANTQTIVNGAQPQGKKQEEKTLLPAQQ